MNRHRNWLLMGWLMGALACSADRLTMGSEPAPDGSADLPTGADAAIPDPGQGTAVLATDSTKLEFGAVALGLSSVRILTISNTGQSGSGALSLNSSNDAFVIRTGGSGDCLLGQTLAARASCTVAIVFAPSTSDDLSGTLTYSASPGGGGSIALSGSGKPGTLSLLAGVPSGQASIDGTGAAAHFLSPIEVAIDQAGTLFVTDGAGLIRKITPAGVVTTLALYAENGDGTRTPSDLPLGPIVVDRSGNIFASDVQSGVWKIAPSGALSIFAGQAHAKGAQDGPGSAALFNVPIGLVVDAAGDLFVADYMNHAIRKITAEGVVTTYAGTFGVSGNADGPVTDAKFNYPRTLTMDSAGNLWVGELMGSANIRKITPAGVVTTIKRTGVESAVAIAGDEAGNLFITDGNNAVLKISSAGVESVFAGNPNLPGAVDGEGAVARFQSPAGLTLDASGNLYVVDQLNHAIRKITPAGVVTTLAGASNSPGSDDGPGDKARFRLTTSVGMAWDGAGNIFVSDVRNNTIRKITSAGLVSTLAGTAGVPGTKDGKGAEARFYQPLGLAIDRTGNLYVADSWNHIIRKITPTGTVTTLAGSPGTRGSSDGKGDLATFWVPKGLAVDGTGNVFVADTANGTIRRITPDGTVTTPFGVADDQKIVDGTGTQARFQYPAGMTMDGTGNLYVVEEDGNVIRKITPAGVVTTLAGSADNERGGIDGTGAAARFGWLSSVAVDGAGNVFAADSDNNAIRKITPAGVVSTVVGVLSPEILGNFPGPLPASLVRPRGLAINPSTGAMAIALADAILIVGP